MDKFYLAKLVANERKNEIDHDLAIRHMLKETERGILRVSRTKALILRFTPAVIPHLRPRVHSPWIERMGIVE